MKIIKINKSTEKKNTNIRKKIVFSFLLGAIIFGTIGATASTLLYSKDITYDNSSSGLSSTNLQDALDELYEQAKNAPSCDSNGNCTVTCPDGTEYITTLTGYKCAKIAGEQLKTNAVTTGDGLYADTYENGRYVYKGASPNNYITFSGSTWRILSVENDGTLKIMKQDSIGITMYDSNTKGAWSNATLKTYLNETYYNTLDYTYIQNHSFNVGTISNASDSLTTTINQEKNRTWTGHIALANISDYIKSNTNTSSCGSMVSINSNSSTCKTSSFIGMTMISSNPWMLSLRDTYRAWRVNSSGSFDYAYVYDSSGGVLPVLFLKSDITLSGSGTSSDPYTIN